MLAERGEGHAAREDELAQGGRGGGERVGEGVDAACARGGARFVEGPVEAAECGQGRCGRWEFEARRGGDAGRAVWWWWYWYRYWYWWAYEYLEVWEEREER